MTYNPNIPTASQSLGETQAGIQQNFDDINTAFSQNHVALTTSTEGNHTKVIMPTITSTGESVSTDSDENALYSDGANVHLYFQPKSNGTPVQMTSNTAITNGANGCTFLPGNLVMQYGSFTAGSGNTAVNFVNASAFSSAPYAITLTVNKNNSTSNSIYVNTITTTGFNARWTGDNSHTCYYIAIGDAA